MADTSILDLVMLLFAVVAVYHTDMDEKKSKMGSNEIREAVADANAVTLEGVQGLKKY